MTFSRAFRDGSWLTRRRMTGYCVILLLAYLVTIGFWVGAADGLKDRAGNPLGADFVNVYAAGLMVRRGEAARVYDWPAHRAVEREITGFDADYYGWHYPPIFLGIAFLAALLPYGWALACYLGIGLLACIMILRRIVPPLPGRMAPIAAFPGLFVNLGNGQNGFVTTALLGAGLYWLETQPVAGGALLGGLAYKPQYFILVPILLACGRKWRALAASLMTAAALSGASWLAFGAAAWRAFFASTRLTQKIILEQGAAGWGKIQSVFALGRALGANIATAYVLQGIVAGAALIAAGWIWRHSRATDHAVRAAALCGAALLATPYLFDYDLTVLAVPVGFLAAAGLRDGFMPYEKSLLAALWLWPFIARTFSLHGWPLTPLLLALLLGLCVMRMRSSRRTAPA